MSLCSISPLICQKFIDNCHEFVEYFTLAGNGILFISLFLYLLLFLLQDFTIMLVVYFTPHIADLCITLCQGSYTGRAAAVEQIVRNTLGMK